VDGVDFAVKKGQTLGIVGESGSGKSVTMLSILGLIPQPPGRILSGSAYFQDQDLLRMPEKQLRNIRGYRISMIFQDPMTSLNPYLPVLTQLTEVLYEHETISRSEAKRRAIESLEMVGIPEAAEKVHHYPHQFSGGMRQRVMIAMALIAKPDIVVADEPTTALDVTVQAQILDLLAHLQKEMGLAVILITHDLGVVAGMADEVLVMYAGRPVETGSVRDIFYRCHHPYTAGLLKSVPRTEGGLSELFSIPGLPPDPAHIPPGCPFAPRCRHRVGDCVADAAVPVQQLGKGHQSVCYLEGGA
ncbi:MAG: ABC transporter ATP-binding protein, partial [Deltaproteobacteria bacterium]|nr:ABC transporter ATP-binding protein [Deltaproteobacteria bacterium]